MCARVQIEHSDPVLEQFRKQDEHPQRLQPRHAHAIARPHQFSRAGQQMTDGKRVDERQKDGDVFEHRCAIAPARAAQCDSARGRNSATSAGNVQIQLS